MGMEKHALFYLIMFKEFNNNYIAPLNEDLKKVWMVIIIICIVYFIMKKLILLLDGYIMEKKSKKCEIVPIVCDWLDYDTLSLAFEECNKKCALRASQENERFKI